MKISRTDIPKLTDDSPCPVRGVHHNQKMLDVPATYLDWFRGQPDLWSRYPATAEYIERMKKVINWELDKAEDDVHQNDREKDC